MITLIRTFTKSGRRQPKAQTINVICCFGQGHRAGINYFNEKGEVMELLLDKRTIKKLVSLAGCQND